MKKITIKINENYTGGEVKEMIEQTLQNERDVVKAKGIIDNVYSLSDIFNNKDVVETKNILAIDFKLAKLIPAVEIIGFDAVNEIIISKHKPINLAEITELPFE